ncbi:MAG TPA: GAF domain-containing protein, partial [Vicinamibacterales bacterium]|nr:GAF domain-containing protein [Vicinamibacterales bacterium]
RISGWAFAHRQIVFNSDAALDLGPVARNLPVPLRYALVVPVFDGQQMLGVIALYASEEFQRDHRRMLESAAHLFDHGGHRNAQPAAGRDGRGESRTDRQVH